MSDLNQHLPPGWSVWAEEYPAESESTDVTGTPSSPPGPTIDSLPPDLSRDPRRKRELEKITGTGPTRKRSVPLRSLVPLLVDAKDRNSAWLDDFADDIIVIDADLHDVLLAYERVRRDRAA